MTDKELLKEYLNGNMNAFHTFYEKYKDSLYTFLKNRSEENADDLFQETFNWERFLVLFNLSF